MTAKGSMKRIRLVAVLLILAIVAGCSTKKNTWASRQYHNITTRYNVYFNANESFKEVVKMAEKMYPQSFDELLPVFAATYPEVPNSGMSDLDRTISKANKAIAKHSITAKPKRKASPTEAYRKFYNQKEFNNMIDDVYLLIGKAQIYQHDYHGAKLTFQNIITNYPAQNTVTDARILLATVSAQTDSPEEAEEQLKNLEIRLKKDNETVYSRQLRLILSTAWADVYIKQERYGEAIHKLEAAISSTRFRGTKARYRFILAQLYERNGNLPMARAYYDKISRMNVPYDVQFSALMNLANTMDSQTQGKELEARYKKMLADQNNNEYYDQIYYALGNLARTQGDTLTAIDYYKKSVDASISNDIQKGLSSLALGGYYYSVEDYYPAYNSYSSAAELLINHPRQKYADSMSNMLNVVGRSLTIVNREDSLQRIAKMSEAERQAYADSSAKVALRQEQSAQQNLYSSGYGYSYQYQSSMPGMKAQSLPTSGRWYFYNNIAVSQGNNDFKARWGQRKLEDNWRRKNKTNSTISDADVVDDLLADDLLLEDTSIKDVSPTSSEYYLQNVPLTEEAMEASNARLERALYSLATAYRSDLHNNQKSLATFNRLLRDFPDNDNRALIYYTIYQMLIEEGKYAEAEEYKGRLTSEFPNNKLALALQDPNYLEKVTRLEVQAEQRYEEALALYRNGSNAEALGIINSSLETYKDLSVEPNFALLKVLVTSYDNNINSYKEDLQNIIKKYPQTSTAAAAKSILAIVESDTPSISTPSSELPTPPKDDDKKTEATSPVVVEKTISADQDYTNIENQEHFILVVVNKNMQINQLAFSIALFNADNYLHNNYQMKEEPNIDSNNKAIVISTFTNKDEVMEYYNRIMNESTTLSADNTLCIAISKDNFERMRLKKSLSGYIPFFEQEYLQNLNRPVLEEETTE